MAQAVEMANDEGADPSSDIKKQNPAKPGTADTIDEADPHKVEKLSKLGGGDDSTAEGVE